MSRCATTTNTTRTTLRSGRQCSLLKLFAAKRPFYTTQVKKDLKHFAVDVWNHDNKDVMMYCFFRRCYDDEERFCCFK